MFVGVGAKRVRELFATARKRQPAIIFIDELDAVGGKRSARDQQYMKQTLNQLLVEMDGFLQDEGVIVIAATNFPESLDECVLSFDLTPNGKPHGVIGPKELSCDQGVSTDISPSRYLTSADAHRSWYTT